MLLESVAHSHADGPKLNENPHQAFGAQWLASPAALG